MPLMPVASVVGSAGFSGARVYSAAGQSIPNNSVTKVDFELERYDTGSYHDTVTNNTRLTIPTTAYYEVGSALSFVGTASWTRIYMAILVDNTTEIVRRDYAQTAQFVSVEVSTQYLLSAGSYVEVTIYQASGIAKVLDTISAYSAEFWIGRLGT